MRRIYLHVPRILTFVVCMLLAGLGQAQLTTYQQVTTKCYTGPTLSFSNTTGTLVGNVNFVNGVDIPPGHKIVDVIVEIVWSKTDDGSCTSTTGIPADLSHVGFTIQPPVGLPQYLATSAGTGPFAAPPTSSSFAGSTDIISDTIVFRDGHPSMLPATLPIPGRDTVRPNNDPLRDFCGRDPYGFWAIGAIDDAPALGPNLCIHSYCITMVTCDFTQLKASCKANPVIALDVSGVHNFEFEDLDSISDVSCKIKSIAFSPANVNCSNIGSSVPVTMTITDHLDSMKSCVSNVIVVDTSKPVISDCFPATWQTRYLDSNGKDTIDATEITITDACLPVVQEVRPLFGGTGWGPRIVLSCVTGFQQFWFKATDGSGNVDSCRIVVDVRDTVAPTAICGRDTAFLTTANNGAITVSALQVDGGSFDVCPPVSGRWIGYHFAPPPTYTCDDIGIDTVRLIVSDNAGNLDTCDNAIIVVIDEIPPEAICQNDTVYLNSSGNGMAFAANIENGSTDTCGVDSININGAASIAYNCSHLNANQPVWFKAFDASGNYDSCMAMVTVRDTFPPIANCKSMTIYVDGAGNASVLADSLNNNSIDVCTGTNLAFEIAGNPTMAFTCSDIATSPNAVTLTVLDSFGNSSTCNTTVTVEDTVPPIAICATPDAYLNNAGIATLPASRLSAGSVGNCGIIDSFVNVVGVGFSTYNCATIFTPQAVTLIVADASGNLDSCQTTVNVLDTVRPTALCEASVTAQLNPQGEVLVFPPSIDSNSTDNCGLVEYLINGADSVMYTCADLGVQTATLTVRDSSSNLRSCLSQIVIVDNIPPTVSCQTTTAYLNISGTVSITPNDVLVFPATADNCNINSSTFSSGPTVAFDCDSLGPRSVMVLVSDDFGNTASCVTTVTVVDTIVPTASCRPVPFTLQLDASGQACVTPFDINNGSSDLCNLDTMLVNGVDSFCLSCLNIGTTSVTLSVLDGSGNQSTCVASVTVNDPITPVAVCQDTTLYLGPSGVVTVTPAMIDGGSSDNCSYTATINGLPSANYGCSQVGTNTAQLIITDVSGNTTQCPANVTILDTVQPTANCIGTSIKTVYLDSTCFATIPASSFNNGSTDNCNASLSFLVGGLPNVTFNANNLNTNPNVIQLSVLDATGNFATCQTDVVILDTISPFVQCQPDTIQMTGSNTVVTPNMINAGSVDNCGAPTLTINGQNSVTFDCSHLGNNPVTLTATDLSGNVDSCSTMVFIEDVAAPVALCNLSLSIYLDPSSNVATLQPAQVDNNSTDNCSIVNYALSRDTFDCSDVLLSPHAITLYVTDQSGNLDSCISQVTVIDTIAPTPICVSSDTLFFSGATINITPAVVNAGTFDNCSVQSLSLSQDTFNCPDIGVNMITLTVIDSSGNTASCIAPITVLDTSAQAIAGPTQVLCTTDSTNMAATAVSGSLTGTWTTASAAIIANPNTATTMVTSIPPGTHTFYWTVSNATCPVLSRDSMVIHMILPSPDSALAGVDQSLCNDSSFVLSANTMAISTAQWTQSVAQDSMGVIINNPTDPASTITGVLPGNAYTFVWELTNGLCGVHATDTVMINIDLLPNDTAMAGPDVTCSPATLAMSATAPSLGTGLWTTPTTANINDASSPFTAVTNFNQDTTTMIWTLSNGVCFDYSVDTMYIILDDIWPIAASDSVSLVPDGTASTVHVISNDFLPPNWSITISSAIAEGPMTNNNDGSFEMDINNATENQYFVYEICNTDCPIVCDTALVVVGVQAPGECYVPNAFTPNGDGANDFFIVPCLVNFPGKATMHIFNRWGNLVYESDNYLSDWDGKHKGQPLPDGVYFYILQIENKEPQKGSIEIRY